MGFNLTTDDVWDERERMGLNKPSKPNQRKVIRNIYSASGELVFKGDFYQRMKFFKSYFGWTNRMTKKGRWRLPVEKEGFKII